MTAIATVVMLPVLKQLWCSLLGLFLHMDQHYGLWFAYAYFGSLYHSYIAISSSLGQKGEAFLACSIGRSQSDAAFTILAVYSDSSLPPVLKGVVVSSIGMSAQFFLVSRVSTVDDVNGTRDSQSSIHLCSNLR